MGSRTIPRLGLPDVIANRLAARGLKTAADVLFRTDLELMQLLDMALSQVQHARLLVSSAVCPPTCTVLDAYVAASGSAQRLPTQLPTLDAALGGGLPCGCISELVGPAGVGKSQMCLMLSLMAALPSLMGGLDGRVVLFDTEKKFSTSRLMDIAKCKFPQLFSDEANYLQFVERLLVIRPSSPRDVLDRLRALHPVMLRDRVSLILLDSVAAPLRTDVGSLTLKERQDYLGQLAVLLKELAEGYAVPVVVTNQVSGAAPDGGLGQSREQAVAPWLRQSLEMGHFAAHAPPRPEGDGLPTLPQWASPWDQAAPSLLGPPTAPALPWAAALGVKWGHAVNVRLCFSMSSQSGLRKVHIAKAPMAPQAFAQFVITLGGLEEIIVPDDMDQP